MAGPIDMKEKGCVSVGYWMNYMTLTVDLMYDLDHRFFKVKFWNDCISGSVGQIDVKQKLNESIRYWVDYITFDCTHDLDLEVSR